MTTKSYHDRHSLEKQSLIPEDDAGGRCWTIEGWAW